LVTVSTLALPVLVAIFFSKRGGDAAWKSLYPTVAVDAGWGIVVLAVLDLVDGIVKNSSRSGEFYEITFYIASAIIAAGAYQLSQEK
jgi:phosphatidylglycerophosphate synthase